jgi:hypothetical protein
MRLDAELDIADALDFAAAIAAGAAQRGAMGSPESLDVRRAQAVGDLARGQQPLDLLPGSLPGSAPDSEAAGTPPRKAPPRQLVLYVHLSDTALRGSAIDPIDPVARLERGNALVTVEQVRAWCGRPDTQIIVKPVIDLEACTWSESDTVPERIKEHVALRDRTCVFPWCTRPARRCHPNNPGDPGDSGEYPCDNDHVIPRGRNGPTCSCNIAPLCRRHHRLKTHSPWSYVVVDPGTYVWTSPHGYQFLRDRIGTLDISEDRPRLRADGTREPARPPDT